MATNYSQVGYGSKGSVVKKLQEQLNNNGYSLDVDGRYGPQTRAAVTDYQKKNNLTVDGIAGDETWGTLEGAASGSSNTGASGTGKTESAADRSFSYNDYKESDTVQQAQALLQQQMASKPGEYTSEWSGQIDAIMDQILNREKFSYDLNADALYQQYADQFTTQGKLAMMDTMGQAQAMTGGYGNSYAQAVGQQTYQGYLQQLNEVVPELYGMAQDQYNQEGQALLNQYGLLADQDQQDYSRYRDEVGDYYTNLQQAYDQYNTERDYDYSKYANERDFAYGTFSDDRSYDYQAERDAVADEQWQKSYDYQQGRDDIADEQWQKEYDEAVRQWNHANGISTGSSGNGDSGTDQGSSTGDTGNNGSNYNAETANIQQMLIEAGYDIAKDGVWGPKTEAAYKDWQAKQGGNTEPTEVEEKMATFVKNMLDNATSSRFNPVDAINANSGLSKEERAIALEILGYYLDSGYMKTP